MMDRMGHVYAELDASLKQMRREIDGLSPSAMPRAILMVTAHWEEPVFTFSAAAKPGMIYDYYGFPPETYEITYEAPGLPEVAERGAELLREGGMATNIDPARGFDHGTFSLMQALYPEADIPVVQMSIRADFDPATHIAAGRLIAPMRDEGVLIIGSGLSYHNLRQMGPGARQPSHAFDGWLQETLMQAPKAERAERLTAWEHAPAARMVHPREDHLMPLHVAMGAAESDTAHMTYHEDAFMGGLAVSSFQFGELPARAG